MNLPRLSRKKLLGKLSLELLTIWDEEEEEEEEDDLQQLAQKRLLMMEKNLVNIAVKGMKKKTAYT